MNLSSGVNIGKTKSYSISNSNMKYEANKTNVFNSSLPLQEKNNSQMNMNNNESQFEFKPMPEKKEKTAVEKTVNNIRYSSESFYIAKDSLTELLKTGITSIGGDSSLGGVTTVIGTVGIAAVLKGLNTENKTPGNVAGKSVGVAVKTTITSLGKEKAQEITRTIFQDFVKDPYAIDVLFDQATDETKKISKGFWDYIKAEDKTKDLLMSSRFGDHANDWLEFKGIGYSDLIAGSALDYGASLVSNYVSSVIKHFYEGYGMDSFKVSSDEMKPGETLLVSAWKQACSKGFAIIGSGLGTVVGHPTAGEKIGKTAGTIIGNKIGCMVVNHFKDENGDVSQGWCGAAGVATVVGATAGGVLTTALIVGGTLTVSIPVAGVVVGGAIIVGAAIGTGVVALLHWKFG